MFADPDYQPTDEDRAALAQILQMRGYEVIQMIGSSECARFDVRVKNLDPEKHGEKYEGLVLEYHRQSKVASMVWQGILQRIALEKVFIDQPKPKGLTPEDPIPDITEGME